MKLNMTNIKSSRIKVQITDIDELNHEIKCNHIASKLGITAYNPDNLSIEVNQVVMVEYRKTNNGGRYVIVDNLIEEMIANVLEVQHIIDGDKMYVSLIFENPETGERMHSLIQSTMELFKQSVIITSHDKVRLKLNDDSLFSIKYIIQKPSEMKQKEQREKEENEKRLEIEEELKRQEAMRLAQIEAESNNVVKSNSNTLSVMDTNKISRDPNSEL